jgi:hypothetical protein
MFCTQVFGSVSSVRGVLGRIPILVLIALFVGCGPTNTAEMVAHWDETFNLVDGTDDIPIPAHAELVESTISNKPRLQGQITYVLFDTDAQVVHEFYDLRTVQEGTLVIYDWKGVMKNLGWIQRYDNGDYMVFDKGQAVLTISFAVATKSNDSHAAKPVTLLTFDIE